MASPQRIIYVVGTESAGKTDLVRQLQAMSVGKLRAQPGQVAPTVGQEIVHLSAPSDGRGASQSSGVSAVEVRELGGSVSSSWVAFIESRLKKDGDAVSVQNGRYALMFVVDATATHMVPAASSAFQNLTASPRAVCHGWPTLVVVQKTDMAHAMTKEEAWALLTGGDPETEAVHIVEVDTWTGKGIRAVLDWVFPRNP